MFDGRTPFTVTATGENDDSQADDLIISTREELISFASRVNSGNSYSGKTVRLVKDITFDGQVDNFTPISGFSGTFDGGGHVISGIVTKPYKQSGLFASVYGGVIKNVIVKDSEFTGTEDAGAIVGEVHFSHAEIINCHGYNNIVNGGDCAGGIVGYVNSSSQIINCTNSNGLITGNCCGGIVGWKYSSCSLVIKNCANHTDIQGDYTSGIAGSVTEVQNCYNTGMLTSASDNGTTYGIARSVSSAGKVKITVNVKPQSVILKAASAKKKQAQLRWSKSNGACGYEIQYSTDSKLKKGVKKIVINNAGTTKRTLSKLKRHKKYYVRIRAYKTVNSGGKSTKLYSGWRKKAVRIK